LVAVLEYYIIQEKSRSNKRMQSESLLLRIKDRLIRGRRLYKLKIKGYIMRYWVLMFFVTVICIGVSAGVKQEESEVKMNLIKNSKFDFHSFVNHRHGKSVSHSAHNIAFWNTKGNKDITVTREAHAPANTRPSFSTHNMVRIAPGKSFYQFATLPELGLAHGEKVSLIVYGYQDIPGGLTAKIKVMKIDSEDGDWIPSEHGMRDKRTFPKHSRGELVVAKEYSVTSQEKGQIILKIDAAGIIGQFTEGTKNKSSSSDINTIGVQIEFVNTSQSRNIWVFAPTLSKGEKAVAGLPEVRKMEAYYRHIPRTIQKLWKGEPIHIILMGSSIDRGSANPPMYPYDENPESPNFKKPLSDYYNFDAKIMGRPDLSDQLAESRHYFSYGGRLKRELMRKFNVSADKICLNFMACDGSCVGEAHSGLKDYCSLSLPPSPNVNGHKAGKTWQKIYPDLFTRLEGPRPDLIIFGSGANEKTDTPDEMAVFEGTIRWIQRHYPYTEFLSCQFQNAGGYTPNPGDMQALSLRYQIPYIDYGKVGDDLTRWCNRYAFVPRDGHPQATSHYVWFKQIEKAFECWDPSVTGQAQLQLPERVHPNTYGWEGDMLTYDKQSQRIKNNMFIFEDMAINFWASNTGKDKKTKIEAYIDGKKLASRGRSFSRRDIRNSTCRYGATSLGDRHILEIAGSDVSLDFIDSKICPNRRFIGVGSIFWKKPDGVNVENFKSEIGAPYGASVVTLPVGKSLEFNVICTDLSVAYVDQPEGGILKVEVDGELKLKQTTNIPFVNIAKKKLFMENRKGLLNLGYGWHKVRLTAEKNPVKVLGAFGYDSRSNLDFERRLNGQAVAGETIPFSLPFTKRPFVRCGNGLKVNIDNVSAESVTFEGEGVGSFEVIGQ
jgi:hypothetical protein